MAMIICVLIVSRKTCEAASTLGCGMLFRVLRFPPLSLLELSGSKTLLYKGRCFADMLRGSCCNQRPSYLEFE